MKLTNLGSMSMEELHGRIKVFGARGRHLCGRMPDGQPLGLAVQKFFADLLVSTTDPAQIAARNEFFIRAEKDPVAKMQLCGIRVDTINNYILASINILPMFFEVINLAEDERPVVQNTTDQEIAIAKIGADGGVTMVKIAKDDDETLITLNYLTTKIVRYRRTDIYRGTIVDAALKTLRLAYDLKNQLDALAYALLTDPVNGAFGAFIYPGSAAGAGSQSTVVPPAHISDYTFLPNSRINLLNLPLTNDIVMSDNSATTSFRYKVLATIRKYADQWAGSFPEGDLIPSGRILIPGADASDIAAEIVPSGNTNNSVADQLLETGYAKINYLGKNWELVTDNTLPPKYCLCEFNRKAGRAYFKPNMDRDVIRGADVYELDKNNEEERWSQKVYGFYISNPQRVNILRIKYRS